MGKYELKTKATPVTVASFIKKVPNAERRADAETLVALMRGLTKEEPKMWGPSIVGFGQYHYKYESGHEGDMPVLGFSPRSTGLVVYILPGFKEYEPLLKKLGKHSLGKSCLYIKRLSEIDMAVLKTMLVKTLAYMKKKYG